jgi:hypothetical protein
LRFLYCISVSMKSLSLSLLLASFLSLFGLGSHGVLRGMHRWTIWCVWCVLHHVWLMNHLVCDMSRTISLSFKDLVPFRSHGICFTFSQSSSSGLFTLIVRDDTVAVMSHLALVARNKSCATV